MSEIRTRLQGGTPFFPSMLNNGNVEICLKEDVDKVLAEKDKTIAELKDKLQASNEQIENLINSASSIMLFQDRVTDDKCAELHHQKYKRCIAMANMCREALCYWDNAKYTFFKGEAYCFRKMNHYGKWGQIWLAIAEKFKETK